MFLLLLCETNFVLLVVLEEKSYITTFILHMIKIYFCCVSGKPWKFSWTFLLTVSLFDFSFHIKNRDLIPFFYVHWLCMKRQRTKKNLKVIHYVWNRYKLFGLVLNRTTDKMCQLMQKKSGKINWNHFIYWIDKKIHFRLLFIFCIYIVDMLKW